MTDHLKAIVTVLSLVNPAICGAMFARIEAGQPRRVQLVDSLKATVTILSILIIAACFGVRILHAFGISIDAFNVAGGGVLVWIGFPMLRGDTTNPAPSSDEPSSVHRPLTPLILFAASPGTITGVITLAAVHPSDVLPMTAIVAVAVAAAVVWLVLLITIRMGKRDRQAGMLRDTLTRFMGLIVVAMGVQFALTGYRAFMSEQPKSGGAPPAVSIRPSADPNVELTSARRHQTTTAYLLCRSTKEVRGILDIHKSIAVGYRAVGGQSRCPTVTS